MVNDEKCLKWLMAKVDKKRLKGLKVLPGKVFKSILGRIIKPINDLSILSVLSVLSTTLLNSRARLLKNILYNEFQMLKNNPRESVVLEPNRSKLKNA